MLRKGFRIEKNIRLKTEYREFRNCLERQIYQYDIKNEFSEIIFLCIGTNKIVGDMIGPMVGEKLENEMHRNQLEGRIEKNMIIYGNMSDTLNFKNANYIINNIQCKYHHPFLITIDTALGKGEVVKKVFIGSGEIEIGKALRNGIKYDSHIYIKGVVGKYSKKVEENINTLRNVEFESIENISNMIYYGIIDVMKKVLQ